MGGKRNMPRYILSIINFDYFNFPSYSIKVTLPS